MTEPSFDTDRTDHLGQRILAQIVDNVAIFAIALVVSASGMTVLSLTSPDLSIGGALLVSGLWGGPLLTALVHFPYNVLFETVLDGQTPGKRAVDIRVVDESGSPPSLLQVLLRNLPSLAIFVPLQLIVAVVAIAVSENHQRLFDMAASTYVVD